MHTKNVQIVLTLPIDATAAEFIPDNLRRFVQVGNADQYLRGNSRIPTHSSHGRAIHEAWTQGLKAAKIEILDKTYLVTPEHLKAAPNPRRVTLLDWALEERNIPAQSEWGWNTGENDVANHSPNPEDPAIKLTPNDSGVRIEIVHEGTEVDTFLPYEENFFEDLASILSRRAA
jgi:hypothetical protein